VDEKKIADGERFRFQLRLKE